MPISPIVLQRRHAELGRIRLGQKGDRGQPQKLDRFRFTSPSESYVRDLAELYGGTPAKWDNKGVPGWEVITTATSIPVIAVKGGLSQWMETWSGGGCVHRCDGVTDVLTGDSCDDGDPNHHNAKPTTRLSVMLPELDAIGVWRMESHGWNAAAEIPAVAELAAYVGDLVPAVLHLVERRAVKDGKTSRFVVPVLDLRIGQARLREVVAAVSNGAAELEAPTVSDAPAIEAPRQQDHEAFEQVAVKIPTPEDIAGADLDKLRKIVGYLERNGAGEHPAAGAARGRIAELEASSDAPQPDEDGVYDADVVDDVDTAAPAADADADAVWQKILATASDKHGWGLDQVLSDFGQAMGGLIPDEASAAELSTYLHTLVTGEEPAA